MPVRQLVLSPRWIMWHLLTLGAVAGCGWLTVWQWQRAGSALGSALNVGYGLQWPLFAVFFAVMWWRMLRLEAAKAQDGPVAAEVPVPRAEQADLVPPAPAGGASPFGPRPPSARPVVSDDPELAAYNRMLAQLAARQPDD